MHNDRLSLIITFNDGYGVSRKLYSHRVPLCLIIVMIRDKLMLSLAELLLLFNESHATAVKLLAWTSSRTTSAIDRIQSIVSTYNWLIDWYQWNYQFALSHVVRLTWGYYLATCYVALSFPLWCLRFFSSHRAVVIVVYSRRPSCPRVSRGVHRTYMYQQHISLHSGRLIYDRDRPHAVYETVLAPRTSTQIACYPARLQIMHPVVNPWLRRAATMPKRNAEGWTGDGSQFAR